MLLLTWFASWFVAACLAGTNAAYGQAAEEAGLMAVEASGKQADARPNVTIEIIGGDSLSVDPGAVVTIVYRVTAQGITDRLLTPHFDIPEGWSIVFGDQAIELGDSGQTTRFVTYKVPEVELAGLYNPVFELSNEAGHMQIGRAHV